MKIEHITNAIERGECKEIAGRRCFIVNYSDFMAILDEFNDVRTSDLLARQHGLENFELRLSSLEEGNYYLCTKSKPVLDDLWKKHFKGATA